MSLLRKAFGKGGQKIQSGGKYAGGITPNKVVNGETLKFVEEFQNLPAPNQANYYEMKKLASASDTHVQTMEQMVSLAEKVLANAVKMNALNANHQENALKASKKISSTEADYQIAQMHHGVHVIGEYGRVEGTRMALRDRQRQSLYGS